MSGRDESTSRVVFHADDYGMNSAVNQGILLAFREGLLTSTSLLANAPSAEQACHEWPKLIAEHASGRLSSHDKRRDVGDQDLPFDLGIHLNLTQGRPLTGDLYPSNLLDKEGNFPGIGKLFFRLSRANSAQLRLVARELEVQVEWMCDRGLVPTHLNGHQYVEIIPQISAAIPGILRRYSIPVVRVARESNLTRNVLLQRRVAAWGLGIVKRHYASRFHRRMRHEQIAHPDRFFGTSHAGRVDHHATDQFLRTPRMRGCTEVGLHPGLEQNPAESSSDEAWLDPLAEMRPREREWLCGSELPRLLASYRIQLARLRSLNSSVE